MVVSEDLVVVVVATFPTQSVTVVVLLSVVTGGKCQQTTRLINESHMLPWFVHLGDTFKAVCALKNNYLISLQPQ